MAILDSFCTWNCVLQCGSSYLIILYFLVDITMGDGFFSTRQVALKCPTPTSQLQIRSLNRELAKTFDVLTFWILCVSVNDLVQSFRLNILCIEYVYFQKLMVL